MSKKACGKNGCTRTHHPLIHVNPPNASNASSVLDRDSILPVVRVLFRSSNGRTREGNVLIDSGAGMTIIRKEFAKSLGLQGKREGLDICVVGGDILEQRDSRRLNMWISPLNGGEEFPTEAVIDKTVLSAPPLDRAWLGSFNHMRDITFPYKAGPIDLILGVHYIHLHSEQEIREGLPFQPVAKRTRLGWSVIGSDHERKSTVASINFLHNIDIETIYELETIGVRAVNCQCPKTVISYEDQEALDLLESSCRREDNRYIISLPWKKDPKHLPDNYELAEKRLVSLEKSLLKDQKKAEMYCKAMKEYEDNGWAIQTERKSEETVFYLPHHGVVRLEKASTPLRVVFALRALFTEYR